MAKIVRHTTHTVVDRSTGEILQNTTASDTLITESEPAYVKLYVQDIAKLIALPHTCSKVLYQIVREMSYSNKYFAYKSEKERMCEILGCSMSHLNKMLGELKKSGILIPVSRGVYLVDPALFARGEWKSIKALQLTVTYTKDGRKQIQGSIMEEEK